MLLLAFTRVISRGLDAGPTLVEVEPVEEVESVVEEPEVVSVPPQANTNGTATQRERMARGRMPW